MRAVVQRVAKSSVTVENRITGSTGRGLVVLLGVAQGDQEADARYLAEKIVNLRIFEDKEGKMNLSLKDIQGEILVVSQFTLLGDCRQGRRPSFTEAAPPVDAERLYNYFVELVNQQGIPVATGVFQAHMQVEIINDGPVTMLLDSRKLF
ncbi:MAG: D-aminoacyl-tRNA deacylase [Bacillota bacterium]|uniref:D-aminoacyl-tRNA deacylase n=1 Tax=Thermanaerosceptrum fracticalcis TaxID=1712410 RepID=A0A7G6DZP2_THEFR|nr:D-aminoacyl-tRNA deacylase [Thermanaerosceptrum fracticalcis]QNB45296.1 D-tyrosyl-tRNA(Tyr) deacylase [Thermanaerosceptrum fracticalcis]